MVIIFLCFVSCFVFLRAVSPSPVSIGVCILVVSFSSSVVVGSALSSWFAYMIFLIYVSGILVMLAYFSAIEPNQKMFSGHAKFCLLLGVFLVYFSDTACGAMWPHRQGPDIMALYRKEVVLLFFVLGLVLFLALVFVVKMSSSLKRPLRPFLSSR